MNSNVVTIFLVGLLLCGGCARYTPKPQGYMRIDLPSPAYVQLPVENLPYTFEISHIAAIELPPEGDSASWINISYSSVNAKIYCSYIPVTPESFKIAEEESRSLVSRQSQRADKIMEREYLNPDGRVYGSLFLLDGASVAPVQFMLTDSVSRFFRGALYYEVKPNADSLAPVTRYILEDIEVLMQSFSWSD